MKSSTIRIAVLMLAFAAVGTAADAKTMAAATAPLGMLQKANDLIGMPVQDANGQNIGTVVDLVLDRNLNTVQDLVVSSRTAQQGWDHFAVPFGAFTISEGGNAVLLNKDISTLGQPDWLISQGWFQGPVDIQTAPLAPQAPLGPREFARDYSGAAHPLIDIYGRPIEGKAMSPYVQNVYKSPVDTGVPLKDMNVDQSKWRSYERDQYGNPVYERNFYTGDQSFGHDGYSVEKKVGESPNVLYGRPLNREFAPSRSDWRWGDSSLQSDYDIYGRPLNYDIYNRPLTGESHGQPYISKRFGSANIYDVYGRPINVQVDRYGKPLAERFGGASMYDIYGRPINVGVDRFGKPLTSDEYGRPLYDIYGRPISRDVDRYGKPLEHDRYSRPLYRDVDRYGRPLYRDTWREREFGTTGRDMGAWFKGWGTGAERLGARRISNLIGTQVDVRGRDAGNIEDVVLDMREGHIAYVLVSLTDAFAGSPNRMAAVPWQAVELMPEQHLASINIARPELLHLAFTGEAMPNLENRVYAQRLHQAFNISPYWETLGYVAPGGVSIYKGTAWNPDSWYAQAFNPNNVTMFEGTIQSVSTFKPAPDATAGLRLRVRTDDGRMLLVNAGPAGFVTQKGISFNIGDRITITGSRAQIAGQNVILASQLSIGDQTVQLRTQQGRPLW